MIHHELCRKLTSEFSCSQVSWRHAINRPILRRLFDTSSSRLLLNLLLHVLFKLFYTVITTTRGIVVVVCGASAAPEVLMSTLVSSFSSWNPIAIYSIIKRIISVSVCLTNWRLGDVFISCILCRCFVKVLCGVSGCI